MSIRHRPDQEERGSVLLRSVVVLVLVGVGLAVVTNGILLAAGSKRGIAWVRTEKKLQSLEDLTASAPGPEAGAVTTPEPAPVVTPEASTPPEVTPMSTAKKPAASTQSSTTTTKSTETKPAQNPPAAGTTAASPTAEKSAPTTTAKPATADVPTVPDSRDPIEAKIAMVKKFYDADAALFVDAREAAEYAEGHIAGAVSLPFDDVFKDPKKLGTIDPKGKPIIVYCGGGECEASKNLAYQLIDAGRKKVVVFTDGYPAWKDAGYAIARGAEPGAAK